MTEVPRRAGRIDTRVEPETVVVIVVLVPVEVIYVHVGQGAADVKHGFCEARPGHRVGAHWDFKPFEARLGADPVV